MELDSIAQPWWQDGSAIPKEMLSKLIESKNANAGAFNLRQIYLATFDQQLHTRDEVSIYLVASYFY